LTVSLKLKRTHNDSKVRPAELVKMTSVGQHFKVIGVEHYARAIPEKWSW